MEESNLAESDSLGEILADTLKSTADWLKFAEAKNAALIGVNLGILVAAEKLQSAIPLKMYLHVVAILCVISLVIALLSVIPRVGWPLPSRRWNQGSEDDNLTFYGDVAKYAPGSYCSELAKKFGRDLTYSEVWTARQIAVLSDLTVQKFRFFSVAAFVTLSAVVTPIGAIVLYCIRAPRSGQ